MTARRRAAALPALMPALLLAAMLTTLDAAAAQTVPTEPSVAIALPPSPGRTAAPAPPRHADPFRYPVIAAGDVPGRHGLRDLPVSLQRRTVRFGGVPTAAMAAQADGAFSMRRFDSRPRSRVTQLRVEDSFPIGAQLEATLGWRGTKVSNRNANAAIGSGSDRLTAHDWFLPRAALRYRPATALTVTLGYRETMQGFEGAGMVGAMGLNRPQFDALRARLRPERARQMRLDGQWQQGAVRLALGGYRAELHDALSFADRGYVPLNLGSARLAGMSADVTHRLTDGLDWTAGYRRAGVRTAAGAARREQQIALGAAWTAGAWRGSLRANRASGAALPGMPTDRAAATRIEAGIEYRATALNGRPLTLSLRLTDPGQLASTRLGDDSGGMRAADRARATLFEATTRW